MNKFGHSIPTQVRISLVNVLRYQTRDAIHAWMAISSSMKVIIHAKNVSQLVVLDKNLSVYVQLLKVRFVDNAQVVHSKTIQALIHANRVTKNVLEDNM